MSLLTAANPSSVPTSAQPTPPPPPATIAETGLHPDTLSQLLLKTLVAGEASGTGLVGQAPPAVLGARVVIAACAGREAHRGSRGGRHRICGLSIHPHRPRSRSGERSFSTSPATSGRHPCRSRSTTPTFAPAWRHARSSIATAVDRVRASHRQQGDARPARAGGQLREGAVPLRQARQRQDRHRGRASAGRSVATMYVPIAVDVDGQIITMFDPVNHSRLPALGASVERGRAGGPGSPLGARSSGRSSSSAAS